MSLNKVNYVDNETIITAKNLNDIQNAIIANEESIINNTNNLNDIKADISGDHLDWITTNNLAVISQGSNYWPGLSMSYVNNPTNLYGNINTDTNNKYVYMELWENNVAETYTLPRYTNTSGSNAYYSIATSKELKEEIYIARGLIFNSANNGCSGQGVATVFVNYFTGKVRIDFSVTITSAGSDTTYFSYGLNRDLLTSVNNQIPHIIPIPGGTISYYNSEGILSTGLNGYGGYMSTNIQFWTPCRVYSIDNPNAVGQWPQSQMSANLKLIGTCYGVLG